MSGQQGGRESRVELGGAVQYRHAAPLDAGMAQWRDVSRAGAGIELGRYLRPGREVELDFIAGGAVATVRARVVWCAPLRGGYAAGLSIYRDSPDAALVMAMLRDAARDCITSQNGNGGDAYGDLRSWEWRGRETTATASEFRSWEWRGQETRATASNIPLPPSKGEQRNIPLPPALTAARPMKGEQRNIPVASIPLPPSKGEQRNIPVASIPLPPSKGEQRNIPVANIPLPPSKGEQRNIPLPPALTAARPTKGETWNFPLRAQAV